MVSLERHMEESFFSGQDRIDEKSDVFKRPIRKGSPSLIGTSDFQKVREALGTGNIPDAQARIGLLHAINKGVTGTFLEWGVALPYTLVELGYRAQEPSITKAGYHAWLLGTKSSNQDALGVVRPILKTLSRETITEYRKKKQADDGLEARFLARPNQSYAAVLDALAKNDCKVAFDYFSLYFDEMRARHDLARDFIHFYVSALQRYLDEDISKSVMQQALESCGVVEGLWHAVKMIPPEAVAAMDAEHLRAHFSGPNREGAVTVMEEKDRYRLVFDPCGTGQALRQRLGNSIVKFQKASPETWGRANEVPPYCSHCAMNELTSVRKVGHLAWVTEFNPDPSKPCGWTIFKNPADIPEHYYKRLGLEKPAIKK